MRGLLCDLLLSSIAAPAKMLLHNLLPQRNPPLQSNLLRLHSQPTPFKFHPNR